MTDTAANTDSIVNPFNGTSDVDKTAEVAQKLWDAGAFNEDGKPDAEQGQADAREEPATPTEERPDWHNSYEAMERAEKFAEESRTQKSQQLQQAIQAGQQAHQQLLAAAQGVNWDQLRAENPQAYEQAVAEYRAREAQIAQHLAATQSQAQELAREYIGVEKEKALRLMPQWRDADTFEAAKRDMLDYARRQGISEAEIASITDHRHMIALYHASQAGKAPPPKAPGVRVRPKASKATPPELRPLRSAQERFRSDPRDIDAQSSYAQRLLDAGA